MTRVLVVAIGLAAVAARFLCPAARRRPIGRARELVAFLVRG